ncbi:putative rnase h domain protein [Mycena kentingensis (nom. inval.)]|nr:putative rnase h domain protein [Mycena kentingensis (nom. inval.)]
MAYDSESEDNPRIVLDESGNFFLKDNLHIGTFKLDSPLLAQISRKVGPGGVLAIRPVPRPAAVSRATRNMGSGEHGVWTASVFVPPSLEIPPWEVFASRTVQESFGPTQRFPLRRRHAITQDDTTSALKTIALYVDGACLDNGDPLARGGVGFVLNDNASPAGADAGAGSVSFALEKCGPDGVAYKATSNRAELRAAIAALEFRAWYGSGFERVVLVTDSEYVANGATAWMRSWAARRWRKADGKAKVANRDLWERLSARMGVFAEGGCEVAIWAVRRDWNQKADRAAKEGATKAPAEKYTEILGVGNQVVFAPIKP